VRIAPAHPGASPSAPCPTSRWRCCTGWRVSLCAALRRPSSERWCVPGSRPGTGERIARVCPRRSGLPHVPAAMRVSVRGRPGVGPREGLGTSPVVASVPQQPACGWTV
jgi:hypothetical protein